VLCSLFASLIIPFIGHAAIVADIDIPPGGKGAVRLIPANAGPQSRQWMAGQVDHLSRIRITFREEYSKPLHSLSPTMSPRGIGRAPHMECPRSAILVHPSPRKDGFESSMRANAVAGSTCVDATPITAASGGPDRLVAIVIAFEPREAVVIGL
jgi:hypothetical protein